MVIGVFDSGLGGLAIANSIMKRLPGYDYLYLGDTKRVPYGARSQETIHEFVAEALNFMFEQDCQIVILACNTASAEALRKTQQEYLPKHYPNRRILGVIIPTAETVVEDVRSRRIGVLATKSTVESDAYGRELRKQNPSAEVFHQAAPLLVPLIENDGLKFVPEALRSYIAPLTQRGVDSIVLGCTHYCLIKGAVREATNVPVVSQDEIIPEKLARYLLRHPESETLLSQSGTRRFCVTDITDTYRDFAFKLLGESVDLEKVSL